MNRGRKHPSWEKRPPKKKRLPEKSTLVMIPKVMLVVLSMAFFITVLKFHWNPLKLWHLLTPITNAPPLENPTEKALCPVTGYRCAEDAYCDCATICGSDQFERVHLDSSNRFIVSNVVHEPGVYCLPKGLDRFLTYNSHILYTPTGWTVASRFPALWDDRGQPVACTNPYSTGPNRLYDFKEDRDVEISDSVDLQERFRHDYRYACRCDGFDHRHNALIRVKELPWACLTDHCKREVTRAGFPGWDGAKCDCGPTNQHMDPGDETSPCIPKPRTQAGRWTYAIPCIDQYSLDISSHFYCPNTYRSGSQEHPVLDKVVLFDERDPYTLLQAMFPHATAIPWV